MASKRLEATFDTDLWEQKDISSPVAGSALRVTRTRTDRTFKGGMNGPAINEYVFVYAPLQGDAKEPTTTTTATDSSEGEAQSDAPRMIIFNGFMHFKGTIEGIDGEGEIVFAVDGTFGKVGSKKVVADWKAIPEMGTGAFKGLKAHGGYEGIAKNMACWLQLD